MSEYLNYKEAFNKLLDSTAIIDYCLDIVNSCSNIEKQRNDVESILFFALTGCNPFDGRVLKTKAFVTEDDIRKNYSEKKVFIFDPEDTSNMPVPGLQESVLKAWKYLPDALKNAFINAFKLNGERLDAWQWATLLESAKEDISICPSCKKATLVYGEATCKCQWCGADIDVSNNLMVHNPELQREKNIKLLVGKKVMISESAEYDGEVLVGAQYDMFKNLSEQTLLVTTPSGNKKEVAPGESFPIIKGMAIEYGEIHCEIE